ncbi:DUF3413 domain-containing protein [Pasteurella skyensis]|uniref:DUF3413 domain-containing protein n=1 Tax=Phocoenobacter skyensis TaxID=97481 RepID=A0AAJ6N8N0_9PAST|nr:DUF3413 domain-containing protein [Pasteurella skyensis]MDP8162423.1 DUF3413 domain-containing protein [Pasteurella skyensis]MDP8172243.1 DUF3413 domain-containing protein [Pasteurella skyensis]MDP8177123.1 DUF3413 domain-containing protein [Pasteurella skyensis]MDP8178498.1 DUF3413 domain-containing protein [Pasteurella skyensis]MDP8182500.1 DUF3413 domain-containing protein [Pasteurella skyensis]
MLKFFQKRSEAISQRITWGHWFTLFNIGIVLFIASRYAFNADWPNTFLGKAYFFISLFGHFSFVVFAVYLLLLFPLSFVIKNQLTFRVISVILATSGMVLLLIDTEVFRTLYLHLSPLVWELFISPKGLNFLSHWQFIIPILTIFIAEIASSYWIWRKLRRFGRQKWGKFVALFFIICFIATHLFYAWADVTLYRPITAQKSNYPLSYPMTAKTFFEKHGFANHSVLEQQIKEHGRPEAFYLNYPKTKLIMDEPEHKINLMIINVATLRPDAISATNMPNLTDIRSNSLYFNQHYTAGNTAMASVVNLFYGLSGQYVDSILNEQQPSPLITTLQQYQYQLGLFSANEFKAPIYRQALFNKLKVTAKKSNNNVIKQWRKWLQKSNQHPSFSYLDLNLPQSINYTKRVQLLDRQIDTLWNTLKEQDQLSNTVVIITASLGEDLTIDNSFDKKRSHIPMMIYWKGEKGDYSQLSSHLDIMPTLLNQFFGVTNPISDYAQGINLNETNNRKWLPSADHKWRVAIMLDGEQYQINPKKGRFKYFNIESKQQKNKEAPLALFLQLIRDSNQFMEK